MRPPWLSRRFALAGALFVAGCARAPAPETGPAATPEAAPAPPAEAAPAPPPTPRVTLAPSEAARRAADRAELTGLELGKMWTFENPPLGYWERTYGFRPTAEWLEHVRLSSVRYGTFCSASFVSPRGLVMTNHHCARSCVAEVSREGEDLVTTGFRSSSREDERLCPGLYLDQLVEIEDVTPRVRDAAPAGAGDAAVAAARQAAIEGIQSECAEETGLVCQVVSLYHGGQFQLYRYRRYQPVKLVFAPELQAGFYGGDPDNFTYPRYALDMAFVRAYEPDAATPSATPHHFEWDAEGAAEGELVFVTGNPGTTSRQFTLDQVLYEARVRHPFLVRMLEGRRTALLEIAGRGPEGERSVREMLFGVENSLKAFGGQLAGLRDTLLMGRKIRWERELRSRVEADRELRARYGDAWDLIATISGERAALYPSLNLYNPDMYLPAPHLQMAALLLRYSREAARPEEERSPAFAGEGLREVEERLRSPEPLDPALSAALLADRLRMVREWLPEGGAFLADVLRAGETPERAAERLVATSRIGDPAYRAARLEELQAVGAGASGGSGGAAPEEDPLLELAARLEERHAPIAARWQELQASLGVQTSRLAGALFAVYGTSLPPDATFTLRISDGVVKRYPYNGTFAPPHTHLYGLYERAAAFSNEMPWQLPPSFEAARERVRMETPLDFVATTDITGGNSGSPMLDREARVVGIAFDGNIEQLPNQFLFSDVAGRTVGVHSAGIVEALRSVYGAESLVGELIEAR